MPTDHAALREQHTVEACADCCQGTCPVLALLDGIAAVRGERDRLHKLVALARDYVDPDEHPDWDNEAYLELETCDTLGNRLAHAEDQLTREAAGREHWRKRCEEAERERDEAMARLGNLLARVHRDGGHRQDAIGTDEACREANMIVANLHAQNAELRRERDVAVKTRAGDVAELVRERDAARAEVSRLREAVHAARACRTVSTTDATLRHENATLRARVVAAERLVASFYDGNPRTSLSVESCRALAAFDATR